MIRGAWLRIPRRPAVARRLAARRRAASGTPLWSSIHGMAGNRGTEEQGLRSRSWLRPAVVDLSRLPARPTLSRNSFAGLEVKGTDLQPEKYHGRFRVPPDDAS